MAFVRYWRNYVNFSGRASRSEYWWIMLVNVIVVAVFFIIGSLAGGISGPPNPDGAATLGPGYGLYIGLSWLWGLANLLPGLGLIWRRLHDSNRSGAFYFMALIPVVGSFIVLVFLLSRPNPAGARFDK
ncbi:DUF805 domain-containing protein [Diaminobutyricibacter tongyongensis]|uniref:DUF805 domain-containing protein n=1 Tax=Leifsonia tongyongensis TaxID=1268043 RepID=A0A6L9XU17_9MICO|nr:DUF805 domain-containing protein [Diaminobutyricibacter tongyongensis]